MNLPTSLLSDFAKVTNDEAEKPKEYTAYGTVVSVNTQTGTYNVLLDGAENPIICDSTTTAKQNDRVTVTIKNRKATVTGNATEKTINGDVLVNGNATFKGRVEADSGYFKGELQAATGSFKGNLDAASGTFSGIVNVNGNTPNGTVQVTIGDRDNAQRLNVPIYIKSTITGQSGHTWYYKNDGTGSTFEHYYGNTRDAYSYFGYSGGTVVDGNTSLSFGPTGVSASNGSRLISSSEISKLGSYPASPPAKWSSPVSWVNREDEYVYTLASGTYHWYVLTKPTDTNYNWYLINAVADENAVWVLHTSQTGAYLYNHGSDRYTNLFITGYWLGIHK